MDCGHTHDHDHDHEDDEGVSLHEYIDLPQVYCLNEHSVNAGRAILKTYSERFQTQPSLQSQRDPDEEPELLLHVPFTEAVAVRSISISGIATLHGDGEDATSAPREVKLFVNRTDIDFDMARELQPTAKLELLPPEHAPGDTTLDYPLRPAGRFQSCSSITLYFGDNYASAAVAASPDDHDDDSFLPTELTYVGFKGRGTNVRRRPVQAVYETRGMKKDHKVPEGEYGAKHGFT